MASVESSVIEIAEAGRLSVRHETLILQGLGGREVAAETLYSAISPGTEIAAFDGLRPLRPDRTFSKVVGYCNLARVIAVGEWVTRFAPGDLILTLESHRSHFICSDDEILLTLPRRDYTATELQEASTTYLFHQAYSALLRGDLKPGQYVGVIGLGTLGLATIATASRFGARAFGFTDRPAARDTALAFGAERVLGKREGGRPQAVDPSPGEGVFAELAEEINTATSGTGLDIVVTTCESWDDWRLALEVARPGGRICVLGFPGRREPVPPFNPLDARYFYRKQLSLVACGYTPDVEIDPRDIRFTIRRNCAYLLELVLDGRLPGRALISAVAPWDRLEDVYRRIAAREPGFLTAVLRWDGEAGVDGGDGSEITDGGDAR